jgi:hypothetical protein
LLCVLRHLPPTNLMGAVRYPKHRQDFCID